MPKRIKKVFLQILFLLIQYGISLKGNTFGPKISVHLKNSFRIDFNPNQLILSKTTADLWSCPLYTMSLRDSTVTTKQSGYSNQLSYLMVNHPKCLSKVSFRPISSDLLFNINISVITRLNKNTMITEDDLLSRLWN